MFDDEEKTYFRLQNGSSCDLEQMATENPEYTQIYINGVKEGNRIKLSLSKNAGDALYILSNRNYDDFRLYFSSPGITVVESIKAKEKVTSFENNVKRVKQQNLLSFFGRK